MGSPMNLMAYWYKTEINSKRVYENYAFLQLHLSGMGVELEEMSFQIFTFIMNDDC